MAVRWYIQSVERQNRQPKSLCQTKLSLKTEGKKEIVLCPSHSHKPPPPPPPSGSPVSRRSSGGDDGNPLQDSCLENPRGAWLAMVHRVIKNQTRQKQLARHVHIVYCTCTYMFPLSKNTSKHLWLKHSKLFSKNYLIYAFDNIVTSSQICFCSPFKRRGKTHYNIRQWLKYSSFKPTGI